MVDNLLGEFQKPVREIRGTGIDESSGLFRDGPDHCRMGMAQAVDRPSLDKIEIVFPVLVGKP